jgi:hypothetical protein
MIFQMMRLTLSSVNLGLYVGIGKNKKSWQMLSGGRLSFPVREMGFSFICYYAGAKTPNCEMRKKGAEVFKIYLATSRRHAPTTF